MNMKTMLNAICIDIVEMIVCTSKGHNNSYYFYERLCKIVEKLKENSRKTRIRDKLTYSINLTDYYKYYLDGASNREYNKPSSICEDGYVVWMNQNCYSRNKSLPQYVCINSRQFTSIIDDHPTMIALSREYVVCEWKILEESISIRRDKLPIRIYLDGRRDKFCGEIFYSTVFQYI